MRHTLSYKEILSIPAGRIMNTLIQEYVLNEHPSRWSNGKQEEVPCHWFEEHPRQCAEDDGGYSSSDSVPNFSGDVSRAITLSLAPALKDRTMHTKTENGTHWATFGDKPFEVDQRHAECNRTWGHADTLALAISRAALLNTSRLWS